MAHRETHTSLTDDSARELIGILNVHKESGWTSHDVVARVRRLAHQKRVGHAGTLDPLAEGVLPVLLGRATRLADFVGEGHKRYRARVWLGDETSTDDAEGEITRRAPVPVLTARRIDDVLAGFRGQISQVPPAYSAVKVGGQRAYAVARRGDAPGLQARPVTIYSLTLLGFDARQVELEVHCSRGTYIRALARDFARALGTAGHLSGLVRTEVGTFALQDARTLARIEQDGVARCLLPPDHVLADQPSHHAAAHEIRALASGQRVPVAGLTGDLVRVYDAAHVMRFVGTADGAWLKARITMAP